MDDYEAFCVADPVFYDAPLASEDGEFTISLERRLPDGWRSAAMDIWTVVHREGRELPSQGWKVHVSACLSNAERILDRTWAYCIDHDISFKFLRSQTTVLAQNTKYADRRGSGKFMTLYPIDDAELEATLRQLGAILEGERGPYILSDLRWGDGPLFVRYGGFVERHCRDDDGELVSAIEDPDGRLVPDIRQPVFRPPAWAPWPPFLADEQVRSRAAGAGEDFPYEVREAMHFSNAGGVYIADDRRTGERVVLKEARPFAGLDREGVDAVTRLEREHRMLVRLAGLPCVPELREQRGWWEHRFLVEELVEGLTVADEVAQRHPLLSADPTAEAIAEYTAWALGVLDQLDAALAAVHARGVVFGDLHPRNVIVAPDGRVTLVDFELASEVEEQWTPTLGAPGFAAPGDRSGFDIDRYAAGCLRLSMFLPFTEMVAWDPGKLDELVEAIEHRFPVPPSFGAEVRAALAPREAPGRRSPRLQDDVRWRDDVWARHTVPAWEPVRRSITDGILASATPERGDRLFPGDPAQFEHGGLGLAYGTAGVLWALAETGSTPPPELVDWLVTAAERYERMTPGFYDGAAGIAFALDALGRRAEARALVDAGLRLPHDPRDPSLFSGMAGIGLHLLHVAGVTESPPYLDRAVALAAEAVALLDADPGAGRSAGLLHGWSGVALFLLRLYEVTGDDRYLDRARQALQRDLDRCTWTPEGTLQVDDGWRVLPYLNVGSAGIGMVLPRLAAHAPDDALDQAAHGIRRAALGDLVIHAGLFNGRAGLMLFLRSVAPADDPSLLAHTSALSWHAVPYRGHVGFVGDHLMRLSTDLATGAAGVLLAMASVIGDRPVGLPFLHPVAPPDGSRSTHRASTGAPRDNERR
jgi:hypothetical protein